MRVPFLDLSAIHHPLRADLTEVARRVIESGWYVLGREVKAFEESFARSIGVAQCVGVANGLDALVLSLRALGVGPGDEVVVPSNTFVATWLAVTQVGAKPVPVDPHPVFHTLQAADAEAALTCRTKVIVPVHLYGQPVDMSAFSHLAEQSGVALLEDAAQAHGASCHGRNVGGWGHLAAWSFYPGKNLGALGDGGAVTTSDENLAQAIRLLGNYGSRTKYVHEVTGVNSRLDELQAGLLNVKLRHLDDHNQRRQDIASMYLSELRGDGLVLPEVPEWAKPVWHLFVIQHPHRERLRARLAEAGIETLIHYPTPPHQQPAYAKHYAGWRLPVAERLSREVLSLPMGPHLSDSQVGWVIETVNRAVKNL